MTSSEYYKKHFITFVLYLVFFSSLLFIIVYDSVYSVNVSRNCYQVVKKGFVHLSCVHALFSVMYVCVCGFMLINIVKLENSGFKV